jgi:hypothetical protein
MTPEKEIEMQMEIDALKAEVKGLKDFVRVLYSMITDDDGEEEYDAADFEGGIEVGRFNT